MKYFARGMLIGLVAVLWIGSGISAETSDPNSPDQPKPALAFDSNAKSRNPELKLLRITPDGVDVPAGRQVVFQFDRPVVPLGRMARTAEEIPITITPAPRCEWRWLDTSALACQLKEADALSPATRYEVKVAPGIAADDGATMAKPVKHHFLTQRPRVKHTRFRQWRAPGWPKIQVTFDQPVSRSSVEKHLRFWLPKSRKSMALSVEPYARDREVPRYLPLPGENMVLDTTGAKSPKADDRPTEIKGEEARRIWVAAPKAEMNMDAEVHLNIAPGLVSALGPEPGVEKRTVVSFDTFPPFRFLGVRCTDQATHNSVVIPPKFKSTDALPETGVDRCVPLDTVALLFSAPVILEEVKAHVTLTPDLAGGRKDYDPWANEYSYSRLRSPHRKKNTYAVMFPELLKAFQRYTLQSDTAKFKDEFGRTLDKPMDMAFTTAHRDPHMVLLHPKATLEKQMDTEVALHVTNLDSIQIHHRVMTAEGLKTDLKTERPVADVEDVAFAMPLGIRELLNHPSGAVSGYLDSVPRIPYYDEEYFRFFAQVTPFQVHVKLGHFNSLVWVTDLATGQPVKDAEVSIYIDSYALSTAVTRLAEATTDAQGTCLLPGIETLDPKLQTWRYYYENSDNRLFVRVDKGGDLAWCPWMMIS